MQLRTCGFTYSSSVRRCFEVLDSLQVARSGNTGFKILLVYSALSAHTQPNFTILFAILHHRCLRGEKYNVPKDGDGEGES